FPVRLAFARSGLRLNPARDDALGHASRSYLVVDSTRLTIFVSAIADQLHQVLGLCADCLNFCAISRIQREAEDARIVCDVFREAETCADDYPGHRGAIEKVADSDVGDAYLVLVRDLLQDREQFLEQGPSAPRLDHVAIFLE